mgnify:CR=1 FL=1
MKLIVGLGNPGKQYEKTRHNVGWMVLDEFMNNVFIEGSETKLKMNNAQWNENKKARTLYLKTEINKQQIRLLKPLTFMNESGYTVAYAVKNHNLNLANDLIVVHDDKDIELGKVKVQTDRSDAGHNGIKSIIQRLGTKNFTRVRVGVGNEKMNRQDTAVFILKKFGLLEKKKLKEGIQAAVEEIMKLIT